MSSSRSDKIVAYSAMLTAVVALLVAIFELHENRKFQRLSVQPYLELSNSNQDGYQKFLINTGLGPARIESVVVKVDEQRVFDWAQVVKNLTGESNVSILYSGVWTGRQLKAEEIVNLVRVEQKDVAVKLFTNDQRLNISVCYCSIYQDCWIKVNSAKPLSVEQCSENPADRFPAVRTTE